MEKKLRTTIAIIKLSIVESKIILVTLKLELARNATITTTCACLIYAMIKLMCVLRAKNHLTAKERISSVRERVSVSRQKKSWGNLVLVTASAMGASAVRRVIVLEV